ncbi:hypothetical protein [Sphingomonas sp. Marseille-Q8236]
MADPNLPPIGRQPMVRRKAPSVRTPWYGDIAGYQIVDGAQVGGERWTTEQQAALIERGMDLLTCPAMFVRRQSVGEEVCPTLGDLPAVYEFECPVIGKGQRGKAKSKIKVIAPDGQPSLVHADGWAHFPRRRPAGPDDGYYQDRVFGGGGAFSRPSYPTTRRPIR